MVERSVVHTDRAPKPVGPYSQAIRSGEFLFSAGQVAIDPASGKLVEGDTAAQAKQVMENLRQVLAASELDFSHVVKTTIYLLDMADFGAVNEVYGAYFDDAPPARTTVAVFQLPVGSRVEIDVVARAS